MCYGSETVLTVSEKRAARKADLKSQITAAKAAIKAKGKEVADYIKVKVNLEKQLAAV